MKNDTQKNEAITKKEPSVDFEIIELDDAVLGSVVGGCNTGNCACSKMLR
jgi:hypothetical protein